MKGNLTALSIFSLAISFLVSTVIISNSINNATNREVSLNILSSNPKSEEAVYKPLLNKEEISEYLGISVEEFDELDQIQITVLGQGIPYVETNNTRYYTIPSVEKWLADINYY